MNFRKLGASRCCAPGADDLYSGPSFTRWHVMEIADPAQSFFVICGGRANIGVTQRKLGKILVSR